ncbi:MAG: hypothetical protein K5648_02965 [Erysipelotrichaceae bacterium]|nr:hypothetical protein [Erysipelotrichaceae bacterium]
MAEQVKGNYKETDTYKNADAKGRAAIERYKKDNKIANEQLYLLLLRQDLRDLPKEEKQRGNRPAEIIVISGIITFLAMTAADRKDLLPFAAVYMIAAAVIYFSGILNPVSRRLSNIKKLLKKFPQVPDLRDVLYGKKEEE